MKRYNNIWDKVNGDIKKEFDSELIYNKFFEKQNNFSKAKTKFCLSLHYKGDESYLYLKKTEMWTFKANYNIRLYNFCLLSVSKDFTKDEQMNIYLIENLIANLSTIKNH